MELARIVDPGHVRGKAAVEHRAGTGGDVDAGSVQREALRLAQQLGAVRHQEEAGGEPAGGGGPGEPEGPVRVGRARAARERSGVPIEPALWAALRALSDELEVPVPWMS